MIILGFFTICITVGIGIGLGKYTYEKMLDFCFTVELLVVKICRFFKRILRKIQRIPITIRDTFYYRITLRRLRKETRAGSTLAISQRLMHIKHTREYWNE